MATLSTALSQALSGLRVASGQSALVARNVARANEEGYSRKYVGLTTDIDGSARIDTFQRNAEKRLTDVLNSSLSASDGQKQMLDSLERLQQTVGDPQDDQSLASAVNRLQNKLRLFETNPANQSLAAGVLSEATATVNALRDASTTVATVREDADRAMKQSVGTINGQLAQLQKLNTAITRMPASDPGLPEAMDERDRLLQSISSEIGIRTVAQADNGVAVYTDGGVTLFNQTARAVTFNPTPAIATQPVGNAIYVDGVAVVGPGSQMGPLRGKIAVLAEVRDGVAPTYQRQLDEIARGLIVAFAEKDATATLPDATGLFSYTGSPTVPTTATVVAGLARDIRVNAAYNPATGGNLMFLRDGGANGAAYNGNAIGSPGYQGRITQLIASIDQPQAFAPDAQLETNVSVKGFAEKTAGWIEGLRSDASRKHQYLEAITTRSKEALSRSTGVNVDDEMAQMLNLERSYQASAKVITIVDQMFASLMEAVR